MVKFYADKIKTGIINQNTGMAWSVDDVPKVWRAKVAEELEG